MNIYHYHAQTKEFLRVAEARIDPKESELMGEDVYLIPKHATSIKPPDISLEADEIFIFCGDHWETVLDYRGAKIYLKANGKKSMTVLDCGSIPSEYTLIPPDQEMGNPVWDDQLEIFIDKSVEFNGEKIFTVPQLLAKAQQQYITIARFAILVKAIDALGQHKALPDEFTALAIETTNKETEIQQLIEQINSLAG